MNQRIKSTFNYLPKIIILGLALFNFLYIWIETIETGDKISFCHICPWYKTSAFIHVPILLVAASLLLISKRWSYITAIALSGYIFAYDLFFLIRGIAYFGLSEMWKWILRSEANILLVQEVQLILAGVIFSSSIIYLVRDALHKKASQSRFM